MPAPAAAVLIAAAPTTRRGRRVLWTLICLTLAALLGLVALFAAAITLTSTPRTGGNCITGLTAPPPAATGARGLVWDAEQRANAQAIAAAGREIGAPQRAIWIALATAMQESTLRNLRYGHADSLGLFQQRPSAGWGTPAELLDPPTSSRLFFTHLLEVSGWEAMPLTQVAQAVQRSAFPDAYARWEQPAADLLAELGGSTAGLACAPGVLASGTAEVAIGYARAQLGKPYFWGGTGPGSFDCSGLVMRAWQAAGVQLPRVSQDQATAGTPIPITQAQPGDLVFWSASGRPADSHHVAMYLGGGQIIEAPTTGVPVRTRALSFTESQLLPAAIRPGQGRAS